MSNLKQPEQEALRLPAREREHLSMWDSLEGVRDIDPEGIAVATARDAQLESGSVATIGHAEFRQRTGKHHHASQPAHGMERQ